jgi:hypothetical protein
MLHPTEPSDNDDRRSQYLIAVGDMCVAAALGSLTVEVMTNRGTRYHGVPGSIRPATGLDEAGDSGYARTIRVDNALVDFGDIVECTIVAPGQEHIITEAA